jgi:archaellum component FlaD/FlaE
MSQGDRSRNTAEKFLDEFEINQELTSIIDNHILPSRIAQKIGEKIKEKNVKITKSQLYRLIEKIQTVLRTTPSFVSTPSEQTRSIETPSLSREGKRTWNDNETQTNDMKQLIEKVELISERLKLIEQNRMETIRESSSKATKTKTLKTTEPDSFLYGDIEPLEQIPQDPESIVVIMKWLQYLVARIGKNNLPDVLGYYVDIGWISDDVRLDLISYSKGITEETGQKNTHLTHLPTKDHLQSLLFIQKLKGVQLDDRFFSKIDRDMEKLIKSLEEYRLK